MTQRVLVTGGQGFVGKALAFGALSKGFNVRVSSRQPLNASRSCLEFSHIFRKSGKSLIQPYLL